MAEQAPRASATDLAQWIITAVGPDRPGLVGDLTGHLHSAGANLLDSRMVNLRGQFALVLLIEAPAAAGEALAAALPDVGERMGLRLTVGRQSPGARQVGGMPFRLKTYSLDQPGLVHQISEVLRSHKVNIEDLSAKQESAPFAGDPLFTMEMRLTVPQNVSIKKLRTDLDALSEKLNCDLDLEPA